MDFTELVATESRGLTAAVAAIVGDGARAEEIVQDAFERCYARWWRVGHYDRPGAWVRRVAINAAISSKRRGMSEQQALRRVAALPAAADVDLADGPAASAVWTAVRGLPRDQATAVVLRYAADLGIEEIARTMNQSPPAVKSLLYRARNELRASETLRAHLDP